MSLISVTNLTFAYEGSYDNIFENASFQLDTSWKLGFTGRNGRGKTTFLQLLLGKYPYSGRISASVSFAYFPYAVENPGLNTIDALESICPDLLYWQIAKELAALEVDEEILYRPFATLSKGEQTKALLAVLFLKENSFLLIDEPTNHLDLHGRSVVSRYLRSKRGFLLVSHDRAFLDGCIDHILSINKTNIEVQKGNFSSWMTNKERQDQFETEQNDRLKKDIRRLESAARQSKTWADKVESTKIGSLADRDKYPCGGRDYIGEQSRRMQQRRKNLERRQQNAIAEKSKLLQNVEKAEELKIWQLDHRASTLAEVKDVSIAYSGRTVCTGVSFTIEQGDRIALWGKNGSGKSSLLKLLLGEDIPHSGTVKLAGGLKISYVPQDASNLSGNLSDYARQWGIDETLFKTILRKLDFSRVQFEKDMAQLSAGQKKKALLARSLCEKAHLYIWDEPMNYIDVLSRIQLEALLQSYQPTILFVEHDKVFCQKIATKTISFSEE